MTTVPLSISACSLRTMLSTCVNSPAVSKKTGSVWQCVRICRAGAHRDVHSPNPPAWPQKEPCVARNFITSKQEGPIIIAGAWAPGLSAAAGWRCWAAGLYHAPGPRMFLNNQAKCARAIVPHSAVCGVMEGPGPGTSVRILSEPSRARLHLHLAHLL